MPIAPIARARQEAVSARSSGGTALLAAAVGAGQRQAPVLLVVEPIKHLDVGAQPKLRELVRGLRLTTSPPCTTSTVEHDGGRDTGPSRCWPTGVESTNHEDVHAGEFETSILLATIPDVVRPDYTEAEHLADDRHPLLTLGMAGYPDTGVIGRPSPATADQGRQLLDAFADLFEQHLAQLR